MAQASRSFADALSIQLQQRLDVGFFIVVATLIGLGLVMVASSSIGISERLHQEPFHFVTRQALYIVVGFVAAYLFYEMPLRLWETTGLILIAIAVASLVLVLVPGVGKTVNGSTRWIDLPLFNIQVSEATKLLVILYMAGYITRHAEAMRKSFLGFFKPMLLIAVLAFLLLLEPDYGGSVVVLLVSLGMLFLGGVRWLHFIMSFAAAAMLFALLAVLSPYRMERLTSFLNPWADPFDTGFQLTQSLIAIGSGSWSGVGLGSSVQKLFYLPEAHNDFMFAILAEELGLIGVMIVLGLYIYAVWRCFAIGATAERTGHLYGSYVAFGVGLWIGIQAFVNIGVNMGVLPTKGLTLPFMSAGGSSMIAMCAAVGLILRVHREVHDLELSDLNRKSRSKGKTGPKPKPRVKTGSKK